MQLVFEQIRSGGDRNFGYLLGDRDAKLGVLIDPSFSPGTFVTRAREQGLTITHVLNTHGHADHTNGNTQTLMLTRARLAAHPAAGSKPAVPLADGQVLTIGDLRLQCFHVPGHCDDHIALFESSYGLLMTGDLLFVGKVGGTPDDAAAELEWHSLQRLIEAVPDSATIWPGHDYGPRPCSTMALERATNPFLRCESLAEFLRMKANWPAFKKTHGLK
jgi:glyoxylase-like metal-dependent hydrolase (beta-lactamase superfamily II)